MPDEFKHKLKEYLFDKPGIDSAIKQSNYVIDSTYKINQQIKNDDFFGISIEGEIKFYQRG